MLPGVGDSIDEVPSRGRPGRSRRHWQYVTTIRPDGDLSRKTLRTDIFGLKADHALRGPIPWWRKSDRTFASAIAFCACGLRSLAQHHVCGCSDDQLARVSAGVNGIHTVYSAFTYYRFQSK